MDLLQVEFEANLFADFPDLLEHLLTRLGDHFLDAAGVDPPVADQLLQRGAGDLPPHRIEAGDDDRLGGVVDDDVDAGGQFEGADVASLAPDDPALHVVAREVHHRDGALGDVFGGITLDRERKHLLRLALGVPFRLVPDVAHAARRGGASLADQVLLEHPTGVLGREAGDVLEPGRLFRDQLLGLPPRNLQRRDPLLELLVALLDPRVLLVQQEDLLVQSDLSLVEEFAPARLLRPGLARFRIKGFARLQDDVLGLDLAVPAQRRRLATGLLEQPVTALARVAVQPLRP